jgi:hypothetical protein
MGVSHGSAHYHKISECCHGLGVFKFLREGQLETFFEMADSTHLPERLKKAEFTVEPWDSKLNEFLANEGLLQDCQDFLHASLAHFPICIN